MIVDQFFFARNEQQYQNSRLPNGTQLYTEAERFLNQSSRNGTRALLAFWLHHYAEESADYRNCLY